MEMFLKEITKMTKKLNSEYLNTQTATNTKAIFSKIKNLAREICIEKNKIKHTKVNGKKESNTEKAS